jgi:hypothetical protein
VPPGSALTVAPRPRAAAEFAAIPGDAERVAGAPGDLKAVVVPLEFALLPVDTVAGLVAAAAARSVRLLICPLGLAALDTEVRRRAFVGRHVRR